MKKDTFQAFCEVASLQFCLTETSLRNHFRTLRRGGKTYKAHFEPAKEAVKLAPRKDGSMVEIPLGSRKLVEEKGMQLVERSLDFYLKNDVLLNAREISSILTALNRSEDGRAMLRLKKEELAKEDNRFDKFLAAAMYGGKIEEKKIIKEAEIDDTQRSIESAE